MPELGRIVMASGGNGYTLARFLVTGPQIGSFTASPNPVAAGTDLTFTADNVVALNPHSNVAQVAFYLDSNGDGILQPGIDTLLGYATKTASGAWTLTVSTGTLTAGTYTLFTQAEDDLLALGDPLAITLQVI